MMTPLKMEIEMISKNESPMSLIFNKKIEPVNLKEKFLYATFEVIAENGADGLSANELIKRTKSSKGALFHHFETIDHLCIESLHFFRTHTSFGIENDSSNNLEDYLKAVAEDSMRKQSNSHYMHLIHFFRDRAIRDERYRQPFNDLFEAHANTITDKVVGLLGTQPDRNLVFKKILFMLITIERASYHKALHQSVGFFDSEISSFLEHIIQSLKQV